MKTNGWPAAVRRAIGRGAGRLVRGPGAPHDVTTATHARQVRPIVTLVAFLIFLVSASVALGIGPNSAQGDESDAPGEPAAARTGGARVSGTATTADEPEADRHEFAADRTATSKTFALPGGMIEKRLYGAPVGYRDAAGEWQPIDEGFKRADAGLESRSHPFEVHLPSHMGSGPVRFGGAKYWISFELEGPESGPAELEAGGAVSYGLHGADTNLEYATLPDGLKETVELMGPSSLATVHYRLETSTGLTPEPVKDGSIVFRAEGGKAVATIPAPTVSESGSPAEAPGVASYALAPRETGGWDLSLTVDHSWLEEPDRNWPIEVDPTILEGEAPSINDCMISSAGGGFGHFCSESTLPTGAEQKKGIFGQVETVRRRDLLNFKWSELHLPKNAEVKEASVNLYAPAAAQNVTGVELRRLTRPWFASSVSWNCAATTETECEAWKSPGGDFNGEGSEILTSERGSQAGWWTFTKGLAPVFQRLSEVTEPIDFPSGEEIPDLNFYRSGFVLKLKEETASETLTRSVAWDSSRFGEPSKRPYVRIVYLPPAPATSKVISPVEGTRTPGHLKLQAGWGEAGTVNGVTFEYRVGKKEAGRFEPIPPGMVHGANGESVEEWPIPPSQFEATPSGFQSKAVYFDAAQINSKLRKEGGEVYVRADFNGSTGMVGYSKPVEAVVDRVTGGPDDATAAVGPGTLDLETGNLVISEADVSIPTFNSGLEFTRTYNSRTPHPVSESEKAEPPSVLGPGWKTGIAVEEAGGSEWRDVKIEEEKGTYEEEVGEQCHPVIEEEEAFEQCEPEIIQVPYRFAWAVVTANEGGELAFEESSPGVWPTPPEMTGWELVQSGSSFKLKDPAGDVTTFEPPAGGNPREFLPVSISQPGASANQARMEWRFKNSEKQLTKMIAPPPPGLSCVEVTNGCRALAFNYGSTPEGERLMSVEYLAPGNGGPWGVADYEYDAKGRLIAEWDPRIVPSLKETYSYGPNGELTEITPPGQEPWRLEYATVEEEVGVGRLADVKRASLVAGGPSTAQTTVAYGVPLTIGGGGPYEMGGAEVARWGQTDVPVEATAIFPPTEVPSTTPPSSWSQASVYYMDSEGYAVNTATPKGGGTANPSISTAEPDEFGNIVRELTPDGRLAVLARSESERKEAWKALETHRRYNSEGTQMIEETGPVHPVQIAGTSGTVEARLETTVEYGNPESLTPKPNLPTRETTWAIEPGSGKELEERVTETQYDWTLRRPEKVITVMGPEEKNIESVTHYDDATGLPREVRQPKEQTAEGAGGKGAGTTKTTYFRPSLFGNEDVASCVSTKYAGLPCEVGQAAQPGTPGQPELLVKRVAAYNALGEPTEIIESPGGGTEHVRKIVASYDVAGRPMVKKAEGGGTFVPKTETLYSPTQGLPVRQELGCESGCAGYSNSFGTSGSGELKRPMGIAVDATGNVYVVDRELNCVKEFSSSGVYLSVIGKCGAGGTGKGEFKEPRTVAVDPSGHIWVADQGNARVEEFNSSGEYIQALGGSGEAGGNRLSVPYGVAVDGQGRVWVADSGKIVEFKESSPGVYPFVAEVTSIEGETVQPAGMTTDSAGDLWIAEGGANRISEFEKVATGYVYRHRFGAAGSGPGQLSDPLDVKLGPWGELLVVDRGNNRVQEFSPTGSYKGSFGVKGSASGQFTEPTGVALGPGGAIYVTDSGDRRVEKWQEGSGVEATTTTYNALGQVTGYEDADGNKTTTTYDIDGRPTSTKDDKGTQTYHYNETSGLLTSMEDSGAGTFTATYDADGNLVERGLPNGLTAKTTYNAVDEPMGLAYTKTSSCGESCTWYEEGLERSIYGQILTDGNSLASDRYKYDNAGRLTETQETPAGGGCTDREYKYDADSNRVWRAVRAPGVGGLCVTSGGNEQNYSYDAADRLLGTGLTYDPWGRITNLPAEYAGGKTLETSYFSENMVASQSQNGVTNTFQLDATGRQRQREQAGGVAGIEIFHYDGPGDSPSWTSLGSTWSRNIVGIGGELAAVQESTGTVTFKLTDLHGDVVASASSSPTATELLAKFRFSEFGEPEGSEQAGRFGWLGGKARRTELSSGVIQMGARSYIPQLGRFLTPDPVPGGSANPYDYADQDPINNFDLTGEKNCINVGRPNEACGRNAAELKRAARRARKGGKIRVVFKSRRGAQRFTEYLQNHPLSYHALKVFKMKQEEVTASKLYAAQKEAERIAHVEAIFDPKPSMEFCRIAEGYSYVTLGAGPATGWLGYLVSAVSNVGSHVAC